MRILVDGYNLLFTIGLPRGAKGPGQLEEARLSLLDFLAEHLQPGEVSWTIVVFDAKRSSRSENSHFVYRGITVRFAYEQDEADDLLELLIAEDPHPDRLLVVSSDRRVQTAATRRHANVIGSEPWLEFLQDAGRARSKPVPVPEERDDRRHRQPSADEIQCWLDEFQGADEMVGGDSSDGRRAAVSEPQANERRDEPTMDKPDEPEPGWDPFPPGYGDDLT